MINITKPQIFVFGVLYSKNNGYKLSDTQKAIKCKTDGNK